ncbi:MAG: Uma2 family endonuclease [Actinomycetota bacterium]
MSQSNLAANPKIYSDEEYLVLEREAEQKHELIDGEIVAMAGASREHNLISGNVFAGFHSRLREKPCESYINDMRVRMKKGRYSYPDVVVVCGEPQFADDEFDVLLNPVVVVEVLSKSTRFRDKTEKLETFQKMESVQECLLIEQDEPHIEHYIKQTPKQWLFKIYEELDEIINLESIDCQLILAEIYAQIQFAERVED